MPSRNPLLAIIISIFLISLAASCAGGGDDDSGGGAPDDTLADDDADDAGDDTGHDWEDDTADDDTGDDTVDDTADDDTIADDTSDDDTVDDDIPFTPWENPDAKADAFKLFYKERMSRSLLAYNRFMLVNDVVPAHTLGGLNVAKSGNDYDIALHPVDNNDIGFTAFNTYQAYKVFRTRELALTLIRQFEGLYVAEKVSGIPGLTCREWEPGFTVHIDGPSGTVTRTKDGAPVEPAESYPAELEGEIVDAFFSDGVFNYRADPADYYFNVESITNTNDFALTFVHSMMPDYLRVSDCCSSFMVSKLGPYAGYFWGNHNSRDNFPDFGMGYFTAWEAMNDEGADADVRASAQRAYESGQRVGDSVVDYGYNLMTVGEYQPYDEAHLIVAGELRPDGTDEGPEWLGSMNSCQMSYMAKALSSEGLSSPFETVENPGSYEIIAIKQLFELIGLPPPQITKTCRSLDDAYVFLTWKDILEIKIGQSSLFDILGGLMNIIPDQVLPILQKLPGALDQPVMSAFAVVYYARLAADQGKGDLLQEAKETMFHLLEIHRLSAQTVLDWAEAQNPPRADLVSWAQDQIEIAARYAHEAGIGNADYTVNGWSRGLSYQQGFEIFSTRPDSTPRALKTDEEIWAGIQNDLTNSDRQIVIDRYWAAFPTEADKPVRRSGDAYEVVGLDGDFHETENISHQGYGGLHLWNELPMCALEPASLDCSWAVLGCERPDLDVSGAVDGSDQTLFDAAWTSFGEGASCDAGNGWCDGADLDHSGTLDANDQAFMTAAQGCWY